MSASGSSVRASNIASAGFASSWTGRPMSASIFEGWAPGATGPETMNPV